MNTQFWQGRRVFLTGHTGFKGAWLALVLHHLGAKVTGYALPPQTHPSLYELAGVGELITSHFGDVRDLNALSQAMQAAQPEVVLHLAAQALVRPSYEDPVGTFASNVMGTVHVCESVRRLPGVRALLCVTSDKCYANQGWEWAYRESDPMGGHDPYSASKGCSELVAASYRDAFFHAGEGSGVALATARAGNVIGGGDWSADRLVPDLLRALDEQGSVLIRRPEATRPWQHVLDALAGYLALAERLHTSGASYGGGWNFGPDESDVRSVRDVVNALSQHLPLRAEFATETLGPHEAASLRLDSAQARRRLNWHPAWSLDESLHRVAQWHQGWREQQDVRALCFSQIQDHLQSMEDPQHHAVSRHPPARRLHHLAGQAH